MAEARLRLARVAIWIARLLLPRRYTLLVRRSAPLPPEALYVLHGVDSAETSKGFLRHIANALGRVLTTAAVLGITFGAIQWFLQTPDRVEAERAALWTGVRAALLFPSQAQQWGGDAGLRDPLQRLVGDCRFGLSPLSALNNLINSYVFGIECPQLRSMGMERADLGGMKFLGSTIRKSNFQCANLAASEFDKALIDDTNFAGASLWGASFNKTSIENIRMHHFYLSNFANVQKLSFEICQSAPGTCADPGYRESRDSLLEALTCGCIDTRELPDATKQGPGKLKALQVEIDGKAHTLELKKCPTRVDVCTQLLSDAKSTSDPNLLLNVELRREESNLNGDDKESYTFSEACIPPHLREQPSNK